MTQKRKAVAILLGALIVVSAFVAAQVDIAIQAIRFDLRTVGESVYESYSRRGGWPTRIEDLEGTGIARLPHRMGMLQQGYILVVWQQDLKPNPEANRDRILAYDNSTLLSRFGWVWVCRGDLRVEYMGAHRLRGLLPTEK